MQPKLFERDAETVPIDGVLLYALGDFQSRGHVLADRELALDRLHGAFQRAFAKFGIAGFTDAEIVKALRSLGVMVMDVPDFVAKRPYRITVPAEIVHKSSEAFRNTGISNLRSRTITRKL